MLFLWLVLYLRRIRNLELNWKNSMCLNGELVTLQCPSTHSISTQFFSGLSMAFIQSCLQNTFLFTWKSLNSYQITKKSSNVKERLHNIIRAFLPAFSCKIIVLKWKWSVQGDFGWAFEKRDLVKDVPNHGRVFGIDDLRKSLPTRTILWLYDNSERAYNSWNSQLRLMCNAWA